MEEETNVSHSSDEENDNIITLNLTCVRQFQKETGSKRITFTTVFLKSRKVDLEALKASRDHFHREIDTIKKRNKHQKCFIKVN
jgi:hypothetical protein